MASADGIHILVVEDEEILRELVTEMLEGHGYRVSSAGSGRAAMAVLAEREIHVVLSDIRMPDGDGIFLLTELRRRHPQIPPVIFMTGFSDYGAVQLRRSLCA